MRKLATSGSGDPTSFLMLAWIAASRPMIVGVESGSGVYTAARLLSPHRAASRLAANAALCVSVPSREAHITAVGSTIFSSPSLLSPAPFPESAFAARSAPATAERTKSLMV
jgi:hypothetical protein